MGETFEKMLKDNHIEDVRLFPGCHATERVCLLAAFDACGIENKKGVGSSSGGGGHIPSSTIESYHWMQRQRYVASKRLSALPFRNIDNIICNRSHLHCLV